MGSQINLKLSAKYTAGHGAYRILTACRVHVCTVTCLKQNFTELVHSVGKIWGNRDTMALRNTPRKSDGFHPFLTLPMAFFKWFNTKLPKNYTIDLFCKGNTSAVLFLKKSRLVLLPEAESMQNP